MPDRKPKPSSGTVRIIAGTLRGSRLRVGAAAGLRPTADRVRETLFNWLAPIIDGARCLDLFAGTGALGIEALSRGAAHCTFVERERASAKALADNIARLDVGNARVVQGDAMDFLEAAPEPCDIVFVDPPFDAKSWPAAIALIERGWLRDGGMAYLEAPDRAVIEVPAHWQLHRQMLAGTVRAALYRRLARDPLS